MKRTEFDQRMNETLRLPELVPFLSVDPLYNGMLTQGPEEIGVVGFGVSANIATFEAATEQGCDALIVHHGLKFVGPMLDRTTYGRFEYLIKQNLLLWSAHFLLDAHPNVGNNAQLLLAFNVNHTEPYMHDGAPWGRVGDLETPMSVNDVFEQLKDRLSPRSVVYDVASDRPVKRIVVVSGGGAPSLPDLDTLQDMGVDLYITGEVHEWNRDSMKEAGISLIAGGHYHTEMFGVQALMPVVESWGLKTVWIDHENDI